MGRKAFPELELDKDAGADSFVSERIKMPKRGVNWAFLKINCKN
jgi:hypothetical protein